MDIKIIKFLISQGANIHAEDYMGNDSCDKIIAREKYKSIHHIFNKNCKKENQSLRMTPEQLVKDNKKRQKELRE